MVVGLLFVVALLLLGISTTPAGASSQQVLPPIPIPTVTVTIPGPVRTIIKQVPGPVRTVVKRVPGPVRTVIKRIPEPGPTVTKTITVTPSPQPVRTVTVTPRPTPTPTLTRTPTPTPEPKTITKVKHDLQIKYRNRLIVIGIAAVIAGIMICLLSMYFVYYVGYREGGRDEATRNISFLEAVREDLNKLRGQ